MGTLHGPALDEDGYPTDEALALLGDWTGTPRSLVEDLLSEILAGYGTVTVTEGLDAFDRPVLRARVATGGWSGNESAVAALDGSMFWVKWWLSSRRGGVYDFEVPQHAWEVPMVSWPRQPSRYRRGWDAAAAVAHQALTRVRETPGLPAGAGSVVVELDATLAAGPEED